MGVNLVPLFSECWMVDGSPLFFKWVSRKPPSQYPAYLHITDIAGLIRGASEGALPFLHIHAGLFIFHSFGCASGDRGVVPFQNKKLGGLINCVGVCFCLVLIF